jgi:hypothetical protein
MLMLINAACTPALSPILASTATVRPTLTALPTSTPTPTELPTDTSTPTVELQPSETPSPTLTATLSCERDTASVLLSASAESLKVGDTVKITVTVNNEGCVALGLPQYRLYIQSDRPESILNPDHPEPVEHYLAVVPGQSDSAEFDLTAVASGQATLTASVSYEVHLGYPGPAYWGYSGTIAPLIITVAP